MILKVEKLKTMEDHKNWNKRLMNILDEIILKPKIATNASLNEFILSYYLKISQYDLRSVSGKWRVLQHITESLKV